MRSLSFFDQEENNRTLFRVCRSWQCMYVLTILTMVERDVGNENDSDGWSITSQMEGERSRRCDREPIIPRRRSISIHQSSRATRCVLKSKIIAIKFMYFCLLIAIFHCKLEIILKYFFLNIISIQSIY